ncbi:F-box/kelch-repeat protein [Melia azedarach]|uniref:F-box/kelch-repeat protein n=1 Tax=Melia azedarach TaxID=155640 RepID=A0ACC1Z0F2_MELAZ|nr:F-box/kelch-repeat protein [Melia azedarach]
MSKEKETEGEEEREELGINGDDLLDQFALVGNCSNGFMVTSDHSPQKKVRFGEANQKAYPDWVGFSSCEGRFGGSASSGVEPQDADYSFVPSLSDELEVLIAARVPRAEYWKFYLLNKRFFSLLKSGEIFKIRREIGFREPSVFMLASGDSSWWSFDRQFKSRRKLPELPSDDCFKWGDKESLCAGTHLIVSGKEIDGGVIWRYELETNNWLKGPSMKRPRCLFASATCGTFAFVAGGLVMDGTEVLNSAERYNPETKSWDHLPGMSQKRKLCSGCYMDNKFYVIGGRNENNNPLTCGEAYDESKRDWELIPDMLKDFPAETFQSPPLIAVVNNELYSLETSSNELRVYLKNNNTWKILGLVPVRADVNRGWGVAFKSLGNELLVIGGSSASRESMTIYTCCPSSDVEELQWRLLECGKKPLSHFIHNCSVMVA